MIETPELPAYARSLGIVLTGEVEAGMPVLTVEFGSMVEGRPQHFHGGATAGLLENAGYAALRTALIAAGCSRLWRTLRELITGWICLPPFHSPLLSFWPPLSPSSFFSSLYNSVNISEWSSCGVHIRK